MFRRKEEDAATDISAIATAAPAAAANGASHSHAHEAHVSTAPAAAPVTLAPTPVAIPSYTIPTATAHRPAAAEPARTPAPASPSVGSYRPTPVAEFNRSPVRPPEAARPAPVVAAPSHTPASFITTEKTASVKPNRRVLTVGNDILLKGEIATCDRLVIEGRVEAKLSDVHTVEIAECGSFKGTAEVEDAEISGIFEGDLIVRNRLVIYATGEVRGNISYGEIEIERGGKLTGQIKTVTNAAPAAKAKPVDVSARATAKETVAA